MPVSIGMIALFVVGVMLALASQAVWEPFMRPLEYLSAFAFIGAAVLPILAIPLAIFYDSNK